MNPRLFSFVGGGTGVWVVTRFQTRDLEGSEPFDFLTLFDYAPADAAAFEDLVAALRTTEEWKYVDREIDIRMVRS